MNNKTIQKECGRSMVEMLGVLAIIGVLSIGGIAGYRIAILKHNVNTFWDTFNKLVVITQQECRTEELFDCWAESPDLGYEDASVPGVIKSSGYFAVGYKPEKSGKTPCYYVSLRHLINPKKMCEEINENPNVTNSWTCSDSDALEFYYGDCN